MIWKEHFETLPSLINLGILFNSLKLYKNAIIFINDNSTVLRDFTNFENIEIIQSEYHNRGKLLPYYYFISINVLIKQS